MSKKLLKIRFVLFDCALAMQILEQEGDFEDSEHIKISDRPWLGNNEIHLRGDDSSRDKKVVTQEFDSNQERNKYFAHILTWIRNEQFANRFIKNLAIGKCCEVRNKDSDTWEVGELLAILPENYKKRYVVSDPKPVLSADEPTWQVWEEARPIERGFIFTQETEDTYVWELS